MTFGEKNIIAIGASSLIAGGAYFSWLILNWSQSGTIPEPKLWIVMTYLALQIGLSFLVSLTWNKRAQPNSELNDKRTIMDERDRLVNTKTEAGASHVYLFLIFIAVLGWFAHHNTPVLIHSLIGAFLMGDLFRTGLQVFNYNRAY